MLADEVVALGDVRVLVRDRGPAPERYVDRSLFGPWHRYEALLVGEDDIREVGFSAFEAVYRLVADHRAWFEARWPAEGPLNG